MLLCVHISTKMYLFESWSLLGDFFSLMRSNQVKVLIKNVRAVFREGWDHQQLLQLKRKKLQSNDTNEIISTSWNILKFLENDLIAFSNTWGYQSVKFAFIKPLCTETTEYIFSLADPSGSVNTLKSIIIKIYINIALVLLDHICL